jgi:N-acetylglucosaminyldiphosphoundecaprenol N-acetyl-beta-D-mannosaminyltransferase
MRFPRIEVLGVPVDCLDSATTMAVVRRMLKGDHPQAVIAVNPEKVMRARNDSTLLDQMMRAGLLIPDGIGVVWLARWKSGREVSRVTGSDLMPRICALARDRGYRIFLYGGKEEVVERVATRLCERFPGVQIAGFQDGYLPETRMETLIERINDSKADIVFLALGSPKQERWMSRYLPRLRVKLCQGVGGTFDVIAGTVNRSPEFFQLVHLEWFYRLMTNPARVIRQQALVHYVLLVMKHHLLRVS